MQQLDSYAIIALAALIHASFQLSVSMLTVMSGHALSRRTSHRRLLRMAGSFVLGTAVMSVLLIGTLVYLLRTTAPSVPYLWWAIVCGLAIGVGIATWAFYYRHFQTGTVLWLPRPFAHFLEGRARRTKQSAEAFSLGLSSIIAELLFLLTPLLIAAFVIAYLPLSSQLLGLLLYVAVASLPLLIIYVLIGGGHSLAKIQQWRETNKRFLQFVAGGALIALGVYLYVDMVVTPVAAGGGALSWPL